MIAWETCGIHSWMFYQRVGSGCMYCHAVSTKEDVVAELHTQAINKAVSEERPHSHVVTRRSAYVHRIFQDKVTSNCIV